MAELTEKALNLMKQEKELQELIWYYEESTQFYKRKLLQDKLNKIRDELELNI